MWNSRDVGSSFGMATIGGLTSNRIYTIRMLAYSTAGQSPLSAAAKVLTNGGGKIKDISYMSCDYAVEQLV